MQTRVVRHFEDAHPALETRELRLRPAPSAPPTTLAIRKREGAVTWHTASIRRPAGPLPEADGTHRRAPHHSESLLAFHML